jgi:hypothetical protein
MVGQTCRSSYIAFPVRQKFTLHMQTVDYWLVYWVEHLDLPFSFTTHECASHGNVCCQICEISHKFDSRHFRGLHTHASLMLFLVEGLMGSFYDVRSTGLAGLGFRLPEESDNNGQHEEYDASSTAIWNKCTGSSFE